MQANSTIAAGICLIMLMLTSLYSSTIATELTLSRSSGDYQFQAATYFGGSGQEQGWPSTPSARDSEGNVYLAVITTSAGLASPSGVYDPSYNGGGGDVLVVKMNANLTQVLKATYLGGSSYESPETVCITPDGRVWVSGQTYSGTFPTTEGAYDRTHNSTGSAEDAFVAVLSSGLDTLIASTFIGGQAADLECSVAPTADGNVYAAFRTTSTGLLTSAGAIQSSHSLGGNDYYLIRLNAALTTSLGSTYFGGIGEEFRPRLAVDNTGNLYCAGTTGSNDLTIPTGAYDSQNGDGSLEALVFRVNQTMDTLLAATYVGGNGTDWAYAMILGDGDDVYLTGHVHSSWPTTPGCFDSTYGGGQEEGSDTYLCRLSSDLSSLKASTYLGGTGWDWGVDLGRDALGNIYVVGETTSSDFPTTPGAYDTTCCDGTDMFIVKCDTTLQSLQMSTVVGGAGGDRWPGILVASDSVVYIIGYTESANLETSAPTSDPTYNGGGDIYVAKFAIESFACGDANSDDAIDISDAVFLISFIFSGGSAPDPYLSGDANCDQTVDISDAVYLISYIFTGGSAPCSLCP